MIRDIQLDILAKYNTIITLLQESRKDLEKLNQMLDKGDKNGKV